MRKYLFCLSAISTSMIVGCTTFTPNSHTIELEAKNKELSFSELRKSYCSGDKKIKDFKFNFVDKDLIIEKGMPLSASSRIQSDFQKNRTCRFKSTIYELTKTPSFNQQYYEISQDTFDQVEKSKLGSYGQYGNCQIKHIMVQSPKSKNVNYTTGVCSRSSGDGSYILNSDVTFYPWNSYQLNLPVITNLVDKSTILEPVEFQNKTYLENEIQSCEDGQPELFGVDNEEKFSAENAISQKDRIWKRYITHFTSVKQVQMEDAVNVELTLDMTGFCKYGRSLDDLKTK